MRIVSLLITLSLLLACSPTNALQAQDREALSVLVYSKTNGYRHQSIPTGIETLQSMGENHGFDVTATEDSTVFRTDRLSSYDAVVFLSTTGDVLGPPGQKAFRTFVENGGGYVGIHAAADTEYDWAWYGRLVGAYFKSHPKIQEAAVRVEDGNHPSTRMLPAEWVRRDEWYNYGSSPRDAVRVLLTLDESTYEGGSMGDDHPIAWCHSVGDGRAWYTGLGHTDASFQDDLFRQHLLGGLRWATKTASTPDTE